MRTDNGNLIPMNQMTEDEQRAIARKGGQASARARRKKKAMREWAAIIGSLPLDKLQGAAQSLAKDMHNSGVDDPDLNSAAVMAQYIKAAMEGDTSAFRALMELNGEQSTNINLSTRPPEEVMAEIVKSIK